MSNRHPSIHATLSNPLQIKADDTSADITSDLAKAPSPRDTPKNIYQEKLILAQELQRKAQHSASLTAIERQHKKNRMTVWERIQVLADSEPTFLFQNWGKNLDGASLVTALITIDGREVALYGHDFTIRAGSMDATNGKKLARLIRMAGEKGIPLVGLNDSAGAFVPAGVGGLEGYAEAFAELRKISGVVPSIMCMFGFNAGGGSYLPRQGSFVIQPEASFIGLTGPAVVQNVLGESISADELGGPQVHSQTGVADFIVKDEVQALQKVKAILRYIPNNHHQFAPFCSSKDDPQRPSWDIDRILNRAINSPTGMNTPIDASLLIQHVCDHGDYFEVQPNRARNTITAFGRIGGHVAGFVANNSAVASGQIDIKAAYKNTRFIRFCNLYNIPVIFFEDTTGFLPGKEQETQGIVQAGRAMLDAIIDLRTPRFLVIVRNAFGGAYASYNNYPTGADLVIALPTTRVAVMGPAGIQFVYKDEIRSLEHEKTSRFQQLYESYIANGQSDEDATLQANMAANQWYQQQISLLNQRYEEEFMNPKEALSLGAISHMVMPWDLRPVLAKQLAFALKHYQPQPLQCPQREFY